MDGRSNKRQSYTLEQKKEILQCSRSMGMREAAKKYGVKYMTLSGWRKKFPDLDVGIIADMYMSKLEKVEASLEKEIDELQLKLDHIRQRKQVMIDSSH